MLSAERLRDGALEVVPQLVAAIGQQDRERLPSLLQMTAGDAPLCY
jgi:hypothetical protein